MFLKLVVVVIGACTLASFEVRNVQLPDNLAKSPLSINEQAKAAELASSLQASEWLGPLAPIAISPFFGITCLCAISQFGGDYVSLNTFVSTNPVLKNPTVFWVFLGLTVLTSLPRFTKVSKPVAQAIDQIEAWAGIITILVIRFLPGLLESSVEPQTATMVQMGFLTVTADLLFAVAAVINIVVINTVKFFFEVMVWLIPFPFVDAVLEAANKSLCLGLMAIYAFSPFTATLLNLILFGICLLMFRWIHRQVGFMRAVIGDPLWSLIDRRFGIPRHDCLTVFPETAFEGFAAKSKLNLRPIDQGWQLIQLRFLLASKTLKLDRANCRLIMKEGMFLNSIEVSGECFATLLFSQRFRGNNLELAKRIGVEHSDEVFNGDLSTELAQS